MKYSFSLLLAGCISLASAQENPFGFKAYEQEQINNNRSNEDTPNWLKRWENFQVQRLKANGELINDQELYQTLQETQPEHRSLDGHIGGHAERHGEAWGWSWDCGQQAGVHGFGAFPQEHHRWWVKYTQRTDGSHQRCGIPTGTRQPDQQKVELMSKRTSRLSSLYKHSASHHIGEKRWLTTQQKHTDTT